MSVLDYKKVEKEKTGDNHSETSDDHGDRLSPDCLNKPNLTEAQVIPFLFALFQKEGAIVSQYYGHIEKGADMALWIDPLTNSLGNPILVEVKIGHLTEPRLLLAEEQLRHYLITTSVQSGLLLYLDVEKKTFGRSTNDSPLIVRLDIRELINRLEKQSLVQILLSERDAMVHLRG